MRLYDLGLLPWRQTQLIYHALAEFSEESIVICTPKEGYTCVGFHQDLSHEIDIDYCRKNGIGFFRREIGGGTVLLDHNQLFYQIIVNRKRAPLDQRILFRRFLDPVLKTYETLGIDASYHPVSDIVVNGRKISGNGGGDIGDCKVMTGSILLDFDFDTMCRVLNLPSDVFRARVCGSMKENITTVKEELDYAPSRKEITSLLVSNFEDLFGTFEKATLGEDITLKMDELETKFTSESWLFKRRKQKNIRNVKIIEGLNLIYDVHNDIKMCLEVRNEEIHAIQTYDFLSKGRTLYLNELLVGKKYDSEVISNAIDSIFRIPQA